mgnify:CR=1 FL=1
MNSVEQLVKLIQGSKLPEDVKASLVAALEKQGLNATTKAMVSDAFDRQVTKKAIEAGADPRNDESYVDAAAELMKAFVQAEAELKAGLAGIEADAKKIGQDLQSDLDAIEAAKVKNQIQG